jgi:hypothetical protein
LELEQPHLGLQDIKMTACSIPTEITTVMIIYNQVGKFKGVICPLGRPEARRHSIPVGHPTGKGGSS